MNTIVSNKWLKLFEEPQGNSTIFLLNPRRQKLLDTIHSRAIHLRISLPAQESNHDDWNKFLADMASMGLNRFLEVYQRGEKDLTFWNQELIRWETSKNQDPLSKKALETWIKSFQEMEIYHQPPATKWTLFYTFIRSHVLPRL